MSIRSLIVSGFAGSLVLAGCAASGNDVAGDEGYLTPVNPKTVDDQRKVCVDRIKENGAFRTKDIDIGVVRWKCGDVQGVTGHDLGQEYCEFHAVQDGKVVDKPSGGMKPDNVECVFTGVYNDVKGDPGSSANAAFGDKLNKALTEDDTNNLKNAKGVKLPALGSNPFTIMNAGANGRFAATTLLHDCTKAVTENKPNRDRVSAVKDGCNADGTSCAKDVEACTLIVGHGEGFRNSDPVICGRAARGALCGASYADLPAALDGFIMTDWEADVGQAVAAFTGKSKTAPTAPARCRYATVDGKPYLHMLICTPDASEVRSAIVSGSVQKMCSDVFGPKIAMTAPLGLVAKLGSVKDPFCDEFNAGMTKLQSVAGK
jgi:hypothetical protein